MHAEHFPLWKEMQKAPDTLKSISQIAYSVGTGHRTSFQLEYARQRSPKSTTPKKDCTQPPRRDIFVHEVVHESGDE